MAQSIYEILADLTTTTSVPGFGDEIQHTIPGKLFPSDMEFESIQKGLIDARAAFKSCKKSDNWSPEYGQKNVDAMEWTITKRPGQTNDKAKILAAKLEAGINMARAMLSAGIDESMILASLTPVYGDEGAQAIMVAIK
jgi:hypothetical protein